MHTERDDRREFIRLCRLMWQRGWVANHDGNVTLRLGPNKILVSPTGLSKNDISEDQLLTVDLSGRKLGGRTRPFSELGMHLRVYQERPDVKVVLHAHPPTATGFALAGMGLDTPCMPEMIVSLGPGIPTVPYGFPGADAEAAMAPYLQHYDALLLARHGVMTWGVDAEMAYLRMELVEHVARISLVAYQLGGVPALPKGDVERLVAKRKKAGLGPEGRAAKAGLPSPDLGFPPRSAAERLPAPAQPTPVSSAPAAGAAPTGSLNQIVDDAVRRVLGK